MPNVTINQPDFRVLLRRLIVPAELGRDPTVIPSAAEAAGVVPYGDDSTVSAASNTTENRYRDALSEPTSRESRVEIEQLLGTLFASYEPAVFRKDAIKKATDVSAEYITARSEKEKQLRALDASIKEMEDSLAVLSVSPSGATQTMDAGLVKAFADDSAYYAATADDSITFSDAGYPPGTPTPLARDRARFAKTVTNAQSGGSSRKGLLGLDLTGFERGVVNRIILNGGTLRDTAVMDADVEQTLRLNLSSDLRTIVGLRGADGDIQQIRTTITTSLAQANSARNDLAKQLDALQASSNLRPFYEPILLDCVIGPYSFQSNGNRMGQPGTASVSFHLPIDSEGTIPSLFLAFRSQDVFNLTALEAQLSGGGTATRGTAVPIQALSILKPNLRETTIAPMDMIQVWAKKRFTTTSNWPGDYYPAFTGFVCKTKVGYSGSTISVTIDAEDVGKILRLARINIDPQTDQTGRAPDTNVTAYTNTIARPEAGDGKDIIRSLLKGQKGAIFGLSQANFLKRVAEKSEGSSTMLKFYPENGSVKLASDFENLAVNIWTDLIDLWPPYAVEFKKAFKMWSTDGRLRWDLCREVADITEFEFYVDNAGVVNYHPPLYFLNPFAPQYYIADSDIINESHITDESKVVTLAEIHSQPGFGLDSQAFNTALRLNAIVSAPDSVIQRYGVRYQSKTVPIFSGTDDIPGREVDYGVKNKNIDVGRDAYARAWLNRRNADVKSATVTIVGTPEMRLCNTVAFVGDLAQTMQAVAYDQVKTAAGIRGATSLLDSGVSPIRAGATATLSKVLVYYISAVNHNYVQGQSFTTTLTLTHGRHWTDPLPAGNVGFSFKPDDNNQIVKNIKAGHGQIAPYADADAMVATINNRLQFIATGQLTLPITDKPTGFDARPAIATKFAKARAKLASEIIGFIARNRSQVCTKLFQEHDPTKIRQNTKDRRNGVVASLSGLWDKAKAAYNKIIDQIKKFFADQTSPERVAKLRASTIKKLTDAAIKKLNAYIKELEAKAESALNDLEEAVYNKIMGGKQVVIQFRYAFDAGVDNLPAIVDQPLALLGIDKAALVAAIDFQFGGIFYIYVSRSGVSLNDAKVVANRYLQQDVITTLKPKNKGQIIVLLNQVVKSVRIARPQVTGGVKQSYFIFGTAAYAVKPHC